MFKALRYRTTQFWADIRPLQLTPAEWSEIKSVLSASELALFEQYSLADQAHGYQVLRTLRDAGHEQPQLLVAALLHDIGKSRFVMSVWDRVWPVLLKKIVPTLYQKWGDGEPLGWKRPFVVIKQHPEWGAIMAEKAGCHETAVALIRRHQDKVSIIETEEDKLLSLLQWSDNQN